MDSSWEVAAAMAEVGSVSAPGPRGIETRPADDEGEDHALLRVACHDIGAPLSALHLNVQRFREQLGGDQPPTREKMLAILARIERLVTDASRLVNDVLSVDPLARTAAPAAETDANELLEDAIAIQAETLDRARSRIVVVREVERAALRGRWDKRALQSVFSNLLQNAARHAPGALITVWLSRTEREMVIRFSNQGVETSAAEQSAAAGARTSGGGHGLGMWIIRRAVIRLGGTMSFGRTSTGGVTVEIRIPPRRMPS